MKSLAASPLSLRVAAPSHQESNLGLNNPASYAGSNSNSIYKLVTALIVKAMRNKKRRRKIFIGTCTKQEYTERVFIFESFIKRTNFL